MHPRDIEKHIATLSAQRTRLERFIAAADRAGAPEPDRLAVADAERQVRELERKLADFSRRLPEAVKEWARGNAAASVLVPPNTRGDSPTIAAERRQAHEEALQAGRRSV